MMKRWIAGILTMALCFSLWGCRKNNENQTESAATESKCAHKLGDWRIIVRPTCTKEGRQEQVCLLCYQSEIRSVAMLPHELDENKICKNCSYLEFDPDAAFVELGIVVDQKYGPEVFANCAWDIKIWNGQVFRGAGDYDKNSGATPVYAFDIADRQWKGYGTVPDMAIHGYEVIDGKLCAAGIDPSGGWDLGNYYYLQDGKWKTQRTIPNGIHNFDMIEFDGKIFAGVGTEDSDDTVAVSEDGGETFTYVPLYKDGKPFDTSDYKWTRTYEFIEYNGQLYALVSFQLGIGSAYMVFRYEGGKMVWLSDQVHSLIGGISVGRKYWNGEFEFDGACYLTAGALYAIRDFSRQESYEKIEMPGKERVADAFLKDGVIYALTFKQDTKTKEYNVVIYQSTTGKTGSFEPTTSFTYPVPPISFDTDGNHFYVGMGFNNNAKAKSGMVLRVKPAA